MIIGLKQSIAMVFNALAYMVIIAGVIFLLEQVYTIAAICILGGWAADRLYFKRWCLGFHYDSMEEASVQTLPVQKGEVDDIVDVEWEKIEEERE